MFSSRKSVSDRSEVSASTETFGDRKTGHNGLRTIGGILDGDVGVEYMTSDLPYLTII
jgi:hypothetical protein